VKISFITITKNLIKSHREYKFTKSFISLIKNLENCNFQAEYILVDSFSNDNTRGLFKKLIRKYQKKIKIDINIILQSDENIYDALNKSIKYAKGEYILFLNSDDCLIKNNFNSIIKDLLNYQKDINVFSTLLYSEKKNLQKKKFLPRMNDYFFLMPFNHQSTLIKKKVYEENYFNLNYKFTIFDWCFNLLDKNYSIQNFDKIVLIKYNVDGHSSNIKGVEEDKNLFLKKEITTRLKISTIEYNLIKSYLYEDIFYKNFIHRLIFNLKAFFLIIKLKKDLKNIFLFSSAVKKRFFVKIFSSFYRKNTK
tara:strand:- start:869 stop:1792 length:924 start_codon:yes stop_codon:yes gene_type:complete